MADWIGVLIDKGKANGGKVLKDAKAKAEQDALLDPGVDSPAGGRGGVGRCSADFSALDGGAQGNKGCHRGRVSDGGGSRGK